MKALYQVERAVLIMALSIGAQTGTIAALAAATAPEPDLTVSSNGLACTEYVIQELSVAHIDVKKKITVEGVPGQVTIRDAVNINQKVLLGEKSNAEVDALVKAKDVRTKGVVTALVAAGLGTEVPLSSGLSQLKKGDFVQYWYYSGTNRLGHAAIVETPVATDGKITLRGSQKGAVGTFKTSLSKADFRYAVRVN